MSESATPPKKEAAKKESVKTDGVKTDGAKTDGAKTDGASSSESSTPSTSSSGGSAGGGAARPISYFSSVSTDAYRSGWDNVFNNTQKPARPAASRPGRRAAPATLELAFEELDADLQARLEAAFRAKAKTRRLGFDKRRKSWRLACDLDG